MTRQQLATGHERCFEWGMSVRLVAVALVCSSSFVAACGGDQAANPPPLIPEAASASVNAPSTRPVPATRTLESKTIGAEGFSPASGPTAAGRPAQGSPANGAWSPTPVNGVMNPSPPAGTPVYGDMNPSPPGR
jgi:hypothetical protein